MQQIYVGLFTEGTTDVRFLQPIVQKTLEQVALSCQGQIDIELQIIEIDKTNLSFTQQVLSASKAGIEEFGTSILCVHADADDATAQNTYANRINPAQAELVQQDKDLYCQLLVAIIPIQETEAWMLADKTLFKREIGTSKTDEELEINRLPETIAKPKEVIEKAIEIARSDLTKKRRRKLNISDLYLPIGQSLELEKLEQLLSYQDFRRNIQTAFKTLNLLH